MQDSHTPVGADETADHERLRLVPATTVGLTERLAGRLDGHPARFAARWAARRPTVPDGV